MSTSVAAKTTPARSWLLAAAGLLWMAGLLWSARATITGRGDAAVEVTSTAYALPGLTSAAIVAGAAPALAVLALLDRRGRTLGATTRFAVATGVGLLVGLLAALSIITINTEGWVYAVVGGTMAAAATIGGALGGFRPSRVVAAVCWATIAVFLIGFVINTSAVRSPLLDLFGAGDSPASQAGASNWFSITQSVVSGLVAGIVGYLGLRRSAVRWPVYALAGAGPGVLLFFAELLTRTAGARVLELAGRVSELERAVQSLLSTGRFNSALIVLFIGAITAIVAIGRTLGPAAED